MEMITAASLIAFSGGSGAWLCDKLLGPSFDALGEQFRAYAGSRLAAIFERAEEDVDRSKVEALPPGFALQFIQKASFSEEDLTITQMWAGLLLNAAAGVSSRHSIFIDVLSQIGPKEARFLDDIFQYGANYPLIDNPPADLRSALFEASKRSIDWANVKSKAAAELMVEYFLNFNFGWPVMVEFAEVYWSPDTSGSKTEWVRRRARSEDAFVVDALSRQRLIEYFDLDFSPGWASPRITGYFITPLGVEFVQSCRRAEKP